MLFDPQPDLRNASEKRRDSVIISATHYRLLRRCSLNEANDALAFFAVNAPWLPEIRPAALIGIAHLRREHPDDWQQRAEACFRPYARVMQPTHLDSVIRPTWETRPTWVNQIICGDCLEQLRLLPDASIDFMLTSPPYAEQRELGVSEWKYPKWTVEWMREVKRVLKPSGSAVIVIRPNLRQGAQRPYVLHMLTTLIEDCWRHCDTFTWIKPDAPPRGRIDFPRVAWEPMYWLSLSTSPYCKPKAIGHFSNRLGLITKKVAGRHIHHKVSSSLATGTARTPNYFVVPVAKNDRSPHNTHTAPFPVELAERLIRMLCPIGGVVLDPFMGGGSTAIAAIKAGRLYVGVEINQRYVEEAKGRIERFRAIRR